MFHSKTPFTLDALSRIFAYPFWGATVGDYLLFCAITLVALLLKRPFARLVARLSSKVAVRASGGKYAALFRSLIRKPLEWLFAIVLFYYASNFIEEPLHRVTLLHWHRKSGISTVLLSDVVDHLFAFAGILFSVLLISRILDFVYRAQAERADANAARERAQLLPLLKDVLKIVLWTIGFFWMLGVVFHVNIPALITGLGIGGVALALAAKESIENLLASFTILADKPFAVDDTVRVGTLEGKVERIGFRSTRLRSADGSLLIVPNKKLIDDSLENLSGRDVRKIKLAVPVHGGMPQAELNDLIEALRTAVAAEPQVQGVPVLSIESFSEATVQLQIIYHLPDTLPESAIQAVKLAVNTRVYGVLSGRSI